MQVTQIKHLLICRSQTIGIFACSTKEFHLRTNFVWHLMILLFTSQMTELCFVVGKWIKGVSIYSMYTNVGALTLFDAWVTGKAAHGRNR